MYVMCLSGPFFVLTLVVHKRWLQLGLSLVKKLREKLSNQSRGKSAEVPASQFNGQGARQLLDGKVDVTAVKEERIRLSGFWVGVSKYMGVAILHIYV